MTAIEIARECGAGRSYFATGSYLMFTDADLSTFVQRIKDEERERCAAECERLANVLSGPNEGDGEYAPMMRCAAAIRSLKSKVGGESTGVRT